MNAREGEVAEASDGQGAGQLAPPLWVGLLMLVSGTTLYFLASIRGWVHTLASGLVFVGATATAASIRSIVVRRRAVKDSAAAAQPE